MGDSLDRARDGLELRALWFSRPCEHCGAKHVVEGAAKEVGDHRELTIACVTCSGARTFRFVVDEVGPSDVTDEHLAAYAAHFGRVAAAQDSDARGYATRISYDSKGIAAYERAIAMARAAGADDRAHAYEQARASLERDRDAATPP